MDPDDLSPRAFTVADSWVAEHAVLSTGDLTPRVRRVMSFVTSFVGPPNRLEVGPSTYATTPLENVTVYGRPYWIGEPRTLDPDGSYVDIERTLRDLDGRFSLVCVGAERAVVATDSLGCGPCFITETVGTGVVVASHLGSLVHRADKNRSLNPVGVVSAIGGSVAVRGRTPYADVDRLLACEYVVVDLAMGRVCRKATYGSPPEIFGIDDQRPGDPRELADLLRQAIERERDVPALLLTAGSDSRAIATQLGERRRRDTTALTYGGWRATDRRGAPGIASSLGMRSRLIGPLRLRLGDYEEPIVTRGAGSTGFDAAPHVAGARAARTHASAVYSGFLGDVLAGNGFETDRELERTRTLTRNLNWVRKCGVDLRSNYTEELATLEAELGVALDHLRDLPPGRASLLVNLMHRQAHYIGGTFDMMHTEVEIATPFFHRPLIGYLLTRTPEDLSGKRLYHRTLYDSDTAPAVVQRGVVSRLSRRAERTRKPYGTVDWPAVLARSKSWMETQVLTAQDDSRLAKLALESLETRATLPLALTALPIIMTTARR